MEPLLFKRSASLAAAALLSSAALASANDWTNWRGPLQNGVSLEHYKNAGKLSDTPAWTYAARGRGAPVVVDGKVVLWGYKGETTDLIEMLTVLDAKSGKKLWEVEISDYLSDSIYNRYTIGARRSIRRRNASTWSATPVCSSAMNWTAPRCSSCPSWKTSAA